MKVQKTIVTVIFITLGFIILDFATGVVKGFAKKKFDSTKMREGLFHKTGIILLMVLGGLADYTQTILNIGITVPLFNTICTGIVLMEIGSIIENLGDINPQLIPEKLRKHFLKLNESEDE